MSGTRVLIGWRDSWFRKFDTFCGQPYTERTATPPTTITMVFTSLVNLVSVFPYRSDDGCDECVIRGEVMVCE